MEINPVSIKSGFDAARSAIETLKSLGSMFSGGERQEIQQKVALAERELGVAEAQIAQALGYPLCRAHFPPVPMLLNRTDNESAEPIYRCPECQSEDPSPEEFAKRARWKQRGSVRLNRTTGWEGL